MKAEEGQTQIGDFLVEYAGYSDTGSVRSINEDDFLLLPDKGVFCLTDGLGGEEHGEIASAIALESIKTLIATPGRVSLFSFRKKSCSLRQMIHHANKSVYEKRRSLRLNAAATIVMLQVNATGVEVANVGDSRMYQWNGQSLIQCTRDHSLIEELCRDNILSREQTDNHPQRHIITRALGAKSEIQAYIKKIDIQKGNLILLCSDGLTTMLAHREIESIFSRYHTDVQRTGRALITAANDAGGRDNITVILLHLNTNNCH
ncbi:MAG TPA: serine/threonine-protein phosphatase [Desulfobulbaceae bacterium]|nr:serine/threonine-protein phosphatase [Desulfobulbaceae bacterium]